MFEPYGPASFMQIQRIHNQSVSCKVELNTELVLVVCPLPKKSIFVECAICTPCIEWLCNICALIFVYNII